MLSPDPDFLELLLVDDGSNGGTASLAHELACGEARLRFVRLERNRGIRRSDQSRFCGRPGELGFLHVCGPGIGLSRDPAARRAVEEWQRGNRLPRYWCEDWRPRRKLAKLPKHLVITSVKHHRGCPCSPGLVGPLLVRLCFPGVHEETPDGANLFCPTLKRFKHTV